MARLCVVPMAMILRHALGILIAASRDLERLYKDSLKRKSEARSGILEGPFEISIAKILIESMALVFIKEH